MHFGGRAIFLFALFPPCLMHVSDAHAFDLNIELSESAIDIHEREVGIRRPSGVDGGNMKGV
ncbi:hypothetical protein DWV00_09620 [Trinickia dinghuensis]|uniref:Uncharacterized protein n=1 Tax=Trinickia dinghuensis TaxID=2291023 RepID=A0A3D8K2S3_9BURK|nr:hypothetical protein DWV00_09620 [Trinickia dinghuensis]